jgi:hypothetical protein
MQNRSANKPLRVNQATTEANETLTGLSRMGKIIVEFGHRKIVRKEELRSRVPARNNYRSMVAERGAA